MAYSQGQQYWIWLSGISGLGARRFDTLLDHYGPAQRIWEELGTFMIPLIGEQAYAALVKARNARTFDAIFAEMEHKKIIAITREDAEYPPLLKTIADAPPTLFARGHFSLADAHLFAIVGARNSTAYGTRIARRIARDLAAAGVTIVSGLARGIDSAAHRGCVDAGARTIAVLGSGVDIIYPPEHQMLADEILALGGSLVSELCPGTPPKGQHFPARNRIISGMSEGIALVEAAKRSGTMSTITFAMEQGREVLAVPGQADSPLSASTHALIREGARLVTSAQEIIEDMGWPMAQQAVPNGKQASTPQMTQVEHRLYTMLAGGPADIDLLIEQMHISPSEMNSLLTIMELQGIIRKLPGRSVESIPKMED